MRRSDACTALVVLENGSLWPSWLDREARLQTEVVTQRAAESLAALARRLIAFLAESELSFATATLVCSASEGDTAARERMLRALVARAADAGGGHVLLVADGSLAERRELGLLAARVDRRVRSHADVTVRFRASARGPLTLPSVGRRVA